MNIQLKEKDLAFFSLILRFAMASLFLGAAIIKVKGGIAGSVEYYSGIFEGSIMPMFLVKAHASVIMIAEFAVAIWLISGFKLRLAWISTAGLLISLAFGMVVVYKFDVASDNYIYTAMCGLGLLLSRFDRYQLGKSATS